MPLALELAAAWLKVLPCEQIGREIEDNLDFLATKMRNVPARHRSMRAVFAHSWAMLAEGERAVLMKLSVFRGGFRPEGAKAIVGASLSDLAALVEKSLLQATPAGRYVMHELLRQFAAEKLAAVPQAQAATQDGHSDYYLAFLQQLESALQGKGQLAALAEIRMEIENVRTGWGWAVVQGKVALINDALNSLYEFYQIRGRFQEGLETFKRTTDQLQNQLPASSSKAILSRTSARQGMFSAILGFHEPAKKILLENLIFARQANNWEEVVFLLNSLGSVAHWQAKYQRAKRFYKESLAVSKDKGMLQDIAYVFFNLGWVADFLGEYAAAKENYQKSLTISRQNENQDKIAASLSGLGSNSFYLGEYEEAEQYYRESLFIYEAIGNRLGSALAIGGLGWVAWGLGGDRLADAKSLIEESLAICRKIGHNVQIAGRLSMLSWVNSDLGDYETALEYGRASRTIKKELDFIGCIACDLLGLGEAAWGLEDYSAARRYLLEGIEISIDKQAFPFTLNSLVIWAAVLMKEDAFPRQTKLAWVAEILTFTIHHQATWQV